MTKVNVEQVTILFDHDIVIMAITNAQNISRDTVTRARTGELKHERKTQDNASTFSIACFNSISSLFTSWSHLKMTSSLNAPKEPASF